MTETLLIWHKTPNKSKQFHKCTLIFQVVKKCNDGAKKMQQTEQMCLIAKEIAFPSSKVRKQTGHFCQVINPISAF